MCRKDIALSVTDLRRLAWDMRATEKTEQSPDTCTTAKSMSLTPSCAAMVQSRAVKLYPHNLLRRRRYVAAQMALGKVS